MDHRNVTCRHGAALLTTRRELEEEQAHREAVLALQTINQVSAPAGDS
jgi:hypothetical protein